MIIYGLFREISEITKILRFSCVKSRFSAIKSYKDAALIKSMKCKNLIYFQLMPVDFKTSSETVLLLKLSFQ